MHFGFQATGSKDLGINASLQEKFSKQFKKATLFSIMPVFKEAKFDSFPAEFFSLLSDNGKKENTILLESADILEKYGEKSIGSADSCLKVFGKGQQFEIIALLS